MNDIQRPATPFPQSPQASGRTGIAAARPEAAVGSEPGTGQRTPELGAARPDEASRPAGEHLDRAVKGAHDTVDRIAEKAAPQVERLQHRAEQLRHTRDEWSESLRSTVRARPLAAMATAVALGVVLAKLTS